MTRPPSVAPTRAPTRAPADVPADVPSDVPSRRTRLGLVAVAAVLALAGCGADEDPAPQGDAPSGSASSSLPEGHAPTDGASPVWNPCDGLDPARIGRALGAAVTVDRGTDADPRCTLRPVQEGGPVVDANYTVFADGLDSAWKTMGAPDDGSVSEPRIAGTDDARLVVNADTSGITATGFLQNGSLIHVVNAAATAPYDRARIERTVRLVMTQLSAGAAEAAAAAASAGATP